MAKRKKHKRQFKVITFKVFYDTDEDILDWWEGIETGERSEMLRDLIRDRATGCHRSNQKSVPEPEVVPMMELARVRDDTTWIREALHVMPSYLEQVIQTVAAMQPAMAAAGGVISLQSEPALSTQVKTEREVNMRKKKW
ncbi:MAG: hypothetical protein GX573_25900 [Chloroflexi bacterium]|nr:hypothetical protein [Chloroflexota bacterium]